MIRNKKGNLVEMGRRYRKGQKQERGEKGEVERIKTCHVCVPGPHSASIPRVQRTCTNNKTEEVFPEKEDRGYSGMSACVRVRTHKTWFAQL